MFVSYYLLKCLTIFQRFSQPLQGNGLQAIKISMYLRKREQIVVFGYDI